MLATKALAATTCDDNGGVGGDDVLAGYVVGLTLGGVRQKRLSREMSSAGCVVGLTLGGGRRKHVSREMSSAGCVVGLTLGGGRRWKVTVMMSLSAG